MNLRFDPSLEPRTAEIAGPIAALRGDGYGFVSGDAMRAIVEASGAADWQAYAASWDRLEADGFMADGGTYRKRRFSCFSVSGRGVSVKPPQPHFQTRENNPLNGGIDRIFAPVEPAIASHAANRAVLAACRHIFEGATPIDRRPAAWHAEMHQFRVEARSGEAGQPSPEGLHRDGVDFVLILLVRRENVEGGVSTIADAGRRPLETATMTAPLDAALIDDRRVFHGASPVTPADPSRPGFRDVLVVTFRAEAEGEGRP